MTCDDCGGALGEATGVCTVCGADPLGYYDDDDIAFESLGRTCMFRTLADDPDDHDSHDHIVAGRVVRANARLEMLF